MPSGLLLPSFVTSSSPLPLSVCLSAFFGTAGSTTASATVTARVSSDSSLAPPVDCFHDFAVFGFVGRPGRALRRWMRLGMLGAGRGSGSQEYGTAAVGCASCRSCWLSGHARKQEAKKAPHVERSSVILQLLELFFQEVGPVVVMH